MARLGAFWFAIMSGARGALSPIGSADQERVEHSTSSADMRSLSIRPWFTPAIGVRRSVRSQSRDRVGDPLGTFTGSTGIWDCYRLPPPPTHSRSEQRVDDEPRQIPAAGSLLW